MKRRKSQPGVSRRRTVICREGLYWLLVFGVVAGWATLREANLLFVLAGMFLGPLVVSRRLAKATLGRLDVRRKTPQGVCAGDLLVVQLDVVNPRKRIGSWAVVVEEQVRREDEPGDDEPIRPTVFLPYVGAGESRGKAYWGRLPQRGRYRLGPLKVSTRFPFGLFRHTVTLNRSDTLTVLPRLGRLHPGWMTRQCEAVQGTQQRQARPTRMSGEFYGVREWRSGDSLRWIHWRSSARHGELIARQFEQRHNRHVAVLVDLWQPDAPEPEHLENVELAVSVAATAAADVCRQGGHNLLVGLAGAEPEWMGGPTSTGLLEQVMQRLATARASSEDYLPALLKFALGRIEPYTDIVLVSTRSVDFGDTRRFAGVWSDPARRAAADRIRLINTASGELAEYFQPQ